LAYRKVVLHAVLRHDGSETRRADGALVPVVELAAVLPAPLVAAASAANDWDRFGGEVCAEELSRRDPAPIRAALRRLGDARLAAKAARLEARLTAATPGQVLYEEVWDGLGFSANREPMRALANLLPLAALEAALATVPARRRLALARGLLFGAAGFLPLAPADAALAGLEPEDGEEAEALWIRHGAAWHATALAPTAWTRARVRPANHPAARLAAGADPVEALRALAAGGAGAGLGPDRATGLVANAVLPFALAYAEQTGDAALLDAAARAWERLPAAEPNEVTRRAQRQVAGKVRLGALGARGQQGLIQLDQTLCAPRRCYECPIAHAVIAAEDASPA
jgi:hypothetical protein